MLWRAGPRFPLRGLILLHALASTVGAGVPAAATVIETPRAGAAQAGAWCSARGSSWANAPGPAELPLIEGRTRGLADGSCDSSRQVSLITRGFVALQSPRSRTRRELPLPIRPDAGLAGDSAPARAPPA
jgi:hypothetical protein